MLSKNEIKFIRGLASARERRESMCFVAEGEKVVAEFLSAGWKIQQLYATGETSLDFDQITSVSPKELERISFLKNPNDVLAVIKMKNEHVSAKLSKHVLCCDHIQDPGNMGTIIRIADWFGIRNVICSPDCADAFNPKVVQSAMGSLARVRVAQHNLQEVFNNNKNIPVIVTSLEGQNLYESDLPEDAFIVMGNESKGVSESISALAALKVRIPGGGKAESLNVAVSAGIICAEISRRSALKGK